MAKCRRNKAVRSERLVLAHGKVRIGCRDRFCAGKSGPCDIVRDHLSSEWKTEVYCKQKRMSEIDRAPKLDSLLFRYFVISVSRALKFDSLLYSCCVASVNKTEDEQPLTVYPGVSSLTRDHVRAAKVQHYFRYRIRLIRKQWCSEGLTEAIAVWVDDGT
jgi:hypothetical protein